MREVLQGHLEQAQARIADLEVDRAALLVRIENAEVQLKYREPEEQAQEIPPEPTPDQENPDPEPGEIRFYKKIHSTPAYDVMRRVADCGCNAWQGAQSADKARKGISRLENGRTNWKNMQHCGSCTGGGVWRVKW